MKLLSVNGICKSFGGLAAVSDMSFEVEEGQIVSIIGPNGAGKTTVFNLLTGFYTCDAGSVMFAGEEISNLSPSVYVEKKLTRTFQNLKLFPTMTVLENVMIGYQSCIHYGRMDAIFNTPKKHRAELEARDRAMEILKSIDMDCYAGERCMNLPYGVQKQLEIARAMVSGPRLLLLDEPAAGMNPQETAELTAFIKQIRDDFKLTVFMIEHHMDLVMEISDRIYVLDFGKLIAAGTPDEVQNNQRVIDAYLGVADDA